MARSFTAALMRAGRAAERAHRANVRAHAAHGRAMERQARADAKEARKAYLEDRAYEAEDLNEDLDALNDELNGLLRDGLQSCPAIDISRLKRTFQLSELPPALRALQRPDPERFTPKALTWIDKLVPGATKRFELDVAKGQRQLAVALAEYESLVSKRSNAVEALQASVEQHNSEIDAFQEGVDSGDIDAITAYFDLVLANSTYPDSFPVSHRVGYIPESKQLIVDFQLPTMLEAIPSVERYTFVRSTDQIREKARSERSRKEQYLTVISQIALRTVHEVLVALEPSPLDIVAFNGFVVAIDPATGREVRPYVISLRTTREAFTGVELRAVDPVACLKRLNATVSRSPAELLAIKPVVDINMADPRFVEEQDVLSALDTRPNLMELTPGEFESLITNLFQSMGLETKLTQASRDGGVDCVAFDPRPVLGGKVVVQAKRYKNTVGVSAVRDLFGTMHNEGASKGILVTTSGYGKAAFTFADGKPIELLSGSNLLYLLKEHAGVDAKIEAPADWKDPVVDVSS
ncbi:restriction endonuclease [Brevundimonas sp. M20]|uniref:restriction endonuclease n=1 Tax=Brevundimonas sp. M20 TaxID=2591463 RepID=UPI0011474539|nr:restriction endonuclease [Brevundimonas sp. M20]QDH72357.1 restriction endonuclease [Brevundimonas sp. M20]